MKHHTLIILLLVLPFCAIANRIDLLKTYADVNKLVKEVYPDGLIELDSTTYGSIYEIPVERKIADSLHIKIWQKVDLNNDGRTDLLVYCHNELFAVMDDNGKLRLARLNKEVNPPTLFPIVQKNKNNTKLFIYTVNDSCKEYNNGNYHRGYTLKLALRMNCTTLIYKYNNFIEFKDNPKPTKNSIKEIVYKTYPCERSCPAFNLDISATNRVTTYVSIENNDAKGIYAAIIDTASFNKIMALINYIDVSSLPSNYRARSSDLTSCDLEVLYNNGEVKSISDYGKMGTYGLMAIYEELYTLTQNQAWKLTSQ